MLENSIDDFCEEIFSKAESDKIKTMSLGGKLFFLDKKKIILKSKNKKLIKYIDSRNEVLHEDVFNTWKVFAAGTDNPNTSGRLEQRILFIRDLWKEAQVFIGTFQMLHAEAYSKKLGN